MSRRPTIKFQPCWKGPIEGYTINTVKKIYSKVSGWYEFEDLLQEAYIKFLQCQKCYSGKVDNAAWFMSLYKRALANQFNTVLQRVARYSFIDYQDPGQLVEMPNQCYTNSEINLTQVLTALPKEFLEVLENMTELTEISESLLATPKETDFRSKNVKALRAHLQKQLGLE